ncbi:MAG: SpoIIE family protein phosphatase [Candidatus Riflebacteria bacterium]|nr:SpoIIE family protein phosphatase [Candidatus Riflebacteria bacterium]
MHPPSSGVPSRSRFLLFFLLFGCIPVFIGGLLSFYALSLEEAYRRESAATALEGDLNATIRRIDPLSVVKTRFQQFKRQLFTRPITPERIHHLYNAAHRRWGFAFDIYFFDERGRLAVPGSIQLRSRAIMQQVWNDLIITPTYRSDDSERFKNAIQNLLGSDFRFNRMRDRQGCVTSVHSKGEDALFFWDRHSAKAFDGVILVAWKIPTYERLLTHISNSENRSAYTLFSRFDGRVKYRFGDEIPTSDAIHVASEFDMYKTRWTYSDGRIWTRAVAGGSTLLAAKSVSGLDLTLWQAVSAITLFILLMLILRFWYRLMFRGIELTLSIRYKLVFLFAFSILIPMMGLTFLGFRTLRDRREVEVADAQKSARDHLNELDADFEGELRNYLRLFRWYRDHPLMRTNLARLRQYADRQWDHHKLGRFEARDINGRILETTDSRSVFEGVSVMFESFAKLAIERHLQDRLPPMKERIPNKIDLMTQMVLESPEIGMVFVLDRPDTVHLVQFGANNTYWYWDVYRDPTHPVAFMTLAQPVSDAIYLFLKHHLRRKTGFGSGAFRMLARNDESGAWYPGDPKPTVELESLMDRVRISRQPISERIKWRDTEWLAVAIPGQNLRGHTLVALYPEEEILRGLSFIRSLLVVGMIIAILISVLTGLVLSGTFLAPIGELSMGITALRERRTGYRVPVLSSDELGDLAVLFNRMIEDLGEMELARVVQESLIPHEMPVIPGYEVDLVNLTASDLGGDYCDAMRMKDGRLLVLIGDVTGHGVSSALLMAMAKAAVFQFAEEGRELIDLMLGLNKLIFRLLKRKKLMTFFAGVLDPTTGRLYYSNAGHPFPYIRASNGEVSQLDVVHVPMGFSEAKARFSVHEMTLNPGDALVMFTDGFVEAQDANGVMFTYERLETLVGDLPSLSARGIRDRLVEEFKKHHKEPELEDDLTLVILKRV